MSGLGRKVFTRERATVADVNGYLMDQTVMQFASTSARNAAIPSNASAKGLRTTQLDTLTETIHDGGTWRRVGGRRAIGSAQGAVTDNNGVIIVAHGLGTTPANIQLTARGQASDLLDRIVLFKARNADSSGFVVFVVRTDTSAYLPGNPVYFDWSAEL